MNLENKTPKEYHKLGFDYSRLPNVAEAGYISASVLSAVRDPLRMLLVKKKETDAMSWGSLVDCLWTTPEEFDNEYIVVPDDAPKDVRGNKRIAEAKKPSADSIAAMDWWNAFDAKLRGRTPITQEQLDSGLEAIRMLDQHPIAHQIHKESKKQVCLVGPSTYIPGAMAKSLLDLLPMDGEFVDAIVDLKTTGGGMEQGQLAKTTFKFDYLLKIAFYGIMAEQAGMGPRPRGIIIWQDSSYPYEVKTRELCPTQLQAAREVVAVRHEKLQNIDPSNIASLFDNTLEDLVLPDWAMDAFMS